MSSSWTCLDATCDFSALYPAEFPEWRRLLGLSVLVVGVLAVLPYPCFVARSRRVFPLLIRQPLTLGFSCVACLFCLVTPYRCVVRTGVTCTVRGVRCTAQCAGMRDNSLLRGRQLCRRCRCQHTPHFPYPTVPAGNGSVSPTCRAS